MPRKNSGRTSRQDDATCDGIFDATHFALIQYIFCFIGHLVSTKAKLSTSHRSFSLFFTLLHSGFFSKTKSLSVSFCCFDKRYFYLSKHVFSPIGLFTTLKNDLKPSFLRKIHFFKFYFNRSSVLVSILLPAFL